MDEIQKLRQALGSIGERYNDAQLRQLSRELDLVAGFLLDLYAYEHCHNTQNARYATGIDGIHAHRTMKERSNITNN
jgi:hypothetical protein